MHRLHLIARTAFSLPALLACMGLGFSGPALAQTQDTATVEAFATLAAPPPILSITGRGNLTFGRIKAPDSSVQACRYSIGSDGNMAVYADGERSNGGVCEAEESWNRGIFIIKCEAGQRVAFTYSTESLEDARGVSFAVEEGQITLEGNSTPGPTQTCRTDNEIYLGTGGTLIVRRGATVPEEPVQVGRISVDIFYEAVCICG